jgi:hypothetical protein
MQRCAGCSELIGEKLDVCPICGHVIRLQAPIEEKPPSTGKIRAMSKDERIERMLEGLGFFAGACVLYYLSTTFWLNSPLLLIPVGLTLLAIVQGGVFIYEAMTGRRTNIDVFK